MTQNNYDNCFSLSVFSVCTNHADIYVLHQLLSFSQCVSPFTSKNMLWLFISKPGPGGTCITLRKICLELYEWVRIVNGTISKQRENYCTCIQWRLKVFSCCCFCCVLCPPAGDSQVILIRYPECDIPTSLVYCYWWALSNSLNLWSNHS